MGLNMLFDNYDLLIDSPNSTAKMRELILQLAVQGKLVEQDPDDEPASALLEKIRPERDQLIKDRKFKNINDDSRVDSKALFAIPKNWSWCRLNDIAAIARGGSPRPIKSFITDSPNGLNWIKIGDTDRKSRYIVSTEEKITKEGLVKTRVVYPGDLILSNSMSYGFPYILKIEGCIHDGWLVIRTPEKLVDKIYMYYLFLSVHAKKSFDSAAAGAVVQNLNADKVRMLTIPLPPLAEQKRIVAKVDQLMDLCDQLDACQEKASTKYTSLNNAALEKLLSSKTIDEFAGHWQFLCDNFDLIYNDPAHVNKLCQAVLQLAVQGKLVPQDLNDEPASELLKRIKAEKEKLIAEGKIKKQKPLPPIAEDEIFYELPQGWKWVRFNELQKITEYGTSQKASEVNVGVPVLRMNNINSGVILYDKLKYVVSTIKDLPRLYLKKYDLLFNRTNSFELVGKTGIFIDEDNKYTFASYLIRVSFFNDLIVPHYINLYLNSLAFRKSQIEPLIIQQCGQANVSGTKLKNTLVPIPPFAEQKRIVSKVDQLMHLCDKLETQLSQSKKDSEMLMQAVLHEAFS